MRRVLEVGKWVLAAALVALLLRRVDGASLLGSVRALSPVQASLAVGLYALFTVLASARWWLLLRAGGVPLPLRETVRLGFVGLFFNNFMPGSIGGDAVRAIYAARETKNAPAALISVALDRMVALFGVASAVLLSGHAEAATLIVAAGLGVGTALFFSPRLRRGLGLQKLIDRNENLAAAIAAYQARPGALVPAAALTLVATSVMLLSFVVLGRAVGLAAAPSAYFVYVPLVMMISVVPLTPGGVGVVEQLYLLYFVGESPNAVIAFVLLQRALVAFCSLPGALVFLVGKHK